MMNTSRHAKRQNIPKQAYDIPLDKEERGAAEQAVVCGRLFVACSGLLRGLIRRLPWEQLRFADRQKLRRALARLEADLELTRTALGGESGSKRPSAALETRSITGRK